METTYEIIFLDNNEVAFRGEEDDADDERTNF